MKKHVLSSKNMWEHYGQKSQFGNKMMSTVESMKSKFRLRHEEVAEIYYWLALPGTERQDYKPQCDRCEYTFIHTFTEMDFILKLAKGDHYFKVPARSGLLITKNMRLITVENNTRKQHRYVTVELAKKGKSEKSV